MTNGAPSPLRIYTDASWDRQNGEVRGAWGAVVVWRDRKGAEHHRVIGGVFHAECPSSTAAEMQAIANVLHAVRKNPDRLRGREVQVFSDNSVVVDVLCGRTRQRVRRQVGELAVSIAELSIAELRERGVTVTLHWVKGHQPDPERAMSLGLPVCEHGQWNRLADKEAYRQNGLYEARRVRRNRRRAKQREAAKARRLEDDPPILARVREEPGMAEAVAQLDARRRREEQQLIHETCHAILREGTAQ